MFHSLQMAPHESSGSTGCWEPSIWRTKTTSLMTRLQPSLAMGGAAGMPGDARFYQYMPGDVRFYQYMHHSRLGG